MTAAIEPTAKGTGWQRFGESSFVFKQGPVVLRLREVRTEDGHVLANVHAFEDVGDGRGESRFMARARVNLTSDRSLPGFVKGLQSAYPNWFFPREKPPKGEAPKPPESQWPPFLDKVCAVLMEQMDSRGTRTRLTPLVGAELAQPMVFRNFVPANTVSGIIAHGGTGKSLLGLILCLAVATGKQIGPFEPLIQGPVLYLDWENDDKVHRRRLSRICQGLGIDFPDNILHYAARGKLSHAESELTEMAYEERAVFSILDSIGFAAGGNLNDSEVSTQAINALKHIPGSKVMVAHVNKIDAASPGEAKTPIGSTFFWNGPQAVYEVRTSQQANEHEDVETVIFALSQNKANLGPRLRRPIGMEVTFHDPAGPIIPVECEIRADTAGGETLPIGIRIRDTLGRAPGGLTTAELAERLGIDDKAGIESMARILRDMRSKNHVHSLSPAFGSGKRQRDYQWVLSADGGFGGNVQPIRPGVVNEDFKPPVDPDFKCAKCGVAAEYYNEKTGLPACERHQ